MDSIFSKNIRIFLYSLLALVYVSGLFIPVMEYDSAQHATMAMHMYLENDFLHLFKGFDDYLDKPHMHFWLSAISFKIFGVSHWAYRLPALIFTMIGAYSCFRLARELYGRKAGHIASFIFLSTQAIILANHDVRTDAVLTGASIYAIWQLVKYIKSEKLLHAILGSIGLGVAFSTKGQLAVLMIGGALLCYILYNGKWKAVFNWKVLIGIVTFLITCIPMLYAYYVQFDLHPEKIVNGQTNVSGIRFIFWDQSFNRFSVSDAEASNSSTDYFFFFHTMLWAFLPWALIAYIAIFHRSIQFVRTKFKHKKGLEFLTVGGFWLIMIIINLSKSKLPHYMNSLFPVLAVLISGYLVYLLESSNNKILKIILRVQYFIISLGSILAIVLVTLVFPASYIQLIFYGLLFAILCYNIYKKNELVSKTIIISVLFSVFVNFCLNTQFYPSLLNYQAGSNMVKVIDEENIEIDDVYIFDKAYSWSLNFYTKRDTPSLSVEDFSNNKGKWLFVYEKDMERLISQNVHWETIYEVPRYRITMLTLPFLNPKTRNSQLSKAYLLQLN